MFTTKNILRVFLTLILLSFPFSQQDQADIPHEDNYSHQNQDSDKPSQFDQHQHNQSEFDNHDHPEHNQSNYDQKPQYNESDYEQRLENNQSHYNQSGYNPSEVYQQYFCPAMSDPYSIMQEGCFCSIANICLECLYGYQLFGNQNYLTQDHDYPLNQYMVNILYTYLQNQLYYNNSIDSLLYGTTCVQMEYQESSSDDHKGKKIVLIIIAIVVFILIALLLIFIIRRIRKSQNSTVTNKTPQKSTTLSEIVDIDVPSTNQQVYSKQSTMLEAKEIIISSKEGDIFLPPQAPYTQTQMENQSNSDKQ